MKKPDPFTNRGLSRDPSQETNPPSNSVENSSDKLKVLFLCAGNACRSPMAEAIARNSAADVLEVRSAGLFPFGRVIDLTLQVLKARKIGCEGLSSKSVAETAPFHPDLIVNMSGWPVAGQAGGARVEEWKVPDPYGEDLATYERICDDIETRVTKLAASVRKGREGRAEDDTGQEKTAKI